MSKGSKIRAGSIEFEVEHRTFGDDGGPAVRVFADVDGMPVQILRFDCFRKNPHYHYDPTGKNEQHPIEKPTVDEAISWTLDQIKENLVEMIIEAGYDMVAQKVDRETVARAVPQIAVAMRG